MVLIEGSVCIAKLFDVIVFLVLLYIILLLCASTRVFVDPSSASMFFTAQVKRYPRTSDRG
jgi:hypothetical protein